MTDGYVPRAEYEASQDRIERQIDSLLSLAAAHERRLTVYDTHMTDVVVLVKGVAWAIGILIAVLIGSGWYFHFVA